jgi:two-component system, NarL family, sensor histidine kinase UhpB
LIVEDNPGDFLLLEEYLRLSQLPVKQILHAQNMAAVVVLIKDNCFDIALLDLSLPDSSGIESVIELGRLLPKTPIVVFSGLSAIEIAMKSISLGAQDYLVKGEFDEKILAKCIKYSIERKKTLEKLQAGNELYEMVSKATNDILWDWDILKDTFSMNDNVKESFGYPVENINLNFFFEHIHPNDVERVRSSLLYHLENRVNSWQEEYPLRTKDGIYKDVFDRGFILFNDDGRPYRMIGSITDLSERKRLEKKLSAHQLNQQKLITEVTILAQEKERDELGKELHDNINQILATVKMYLGLMRSNQNVSENLLERSYQFVNEAIEEIRKLSKTLVAPSLGGSGLQQALLGLTNDANAADGLQVHLLYEIGSEQEIGNKKELALYRIVQEQLNNIRKHAKAQSVTITMKTEEDNLYLSIADDGIGFDTSRKAGGIGLQNIRSRLEFYAGNMKIISAPGNGCKLEITIPC